MLTKGIEVQKYIKASAGRANLNVVFEDQNQPRHDGKTIYLPNITHKTTEEELKQLMASTDHEVAHDRFSSFKVLSSKKLKSESLLMHIWNMLEDSRVNAIEAKEYRGFRENWDECAAALIGPILSSCEADLEKVGESNPLSEIISAMICWETKVSGELFPQSELVSSTFKPNKEITDVLNSYSGRLTDCHNILNKEIGTESTFSLAKDIIEALSEVYKDNIKDIAISAENLGTDNSKDGKEGDEDNKEDNPDSSEGDIDDKGKRYKSKEFEVKEVVLTPEQMKKFTLTIPRDGEEMGRTGMNFKPTGSTGGWDLTSFDKFVVIDYPKKLGDPRFFMDDGSFKSDYNIRIKPNVVSQDNFAQQVRKLIQIRAKSQTEYGVKKGKLDQARLSRVCFKAPGFSDKIFKHKINNKTLDTAITVLVDMSGSMAGYKVLYAYAATLLMNEVCSTINVPLEILGFTDGYKEGSTASPFMYIYKGFNDLRVSEDDLLTSFACSSRFMAGNPDGENILWAYDRLLKRKERRKIMVVMSDGCPAASKSSDGIEEFTLKVIREIEAANKVDLFGLGLLSEYVSEYYKHHSIVTAVEQIPTKLIELIERKMLNG